MWPPMYSSSCESSCEKAPDVLFKACAHHRGQLGRGGMHSHLGCYLHHCHHAALLVLYRVGQDVVCVEPS